MQEHPQHLQSVGTPHVGERERPDADQLIVAALADSLRQPGRQRGRDGRGRQPGEAPAEFGPVHGGAAGRNRYRIGQAGLLTG
jgi:hypothetical protein